MTFGKSGSARTARARIASVLALPVMMIAASLVGIQPAAADAPPSFENDPNSVGSVALYDASGAVVTSGSITSHPFASYLAASGGATVGSPANPKATAYAYTPQDGVNPANWTGDTLTASTAFGAAASANYPGMLKGSTSAIAAGTATDFSFTDYMSEFPAGSSKDPNIYEIRVYTGNSAAYYHLDIKVDQTAGTWTQIFPASVTAPTATSTVIAASPVSTAPAGSTITLGATVSPAAAGSVQFFDGNTAVGASVALSGGTATQAVPVTVAGTHSYTAHFTPADPATYAASASAALPYSVTPAATVTTIAASTARPRFGTAFLATVTVRAAGLVPTGSVTVRYGTLALAVKALSGGRAVLTIPGNRIPVGARALVASYSGSASAKASSASTVVSVQKAVSSAVIGVNRTTISHAAHATLSIRVTAPGVVPTGQVKIYDGRRLLRVLNLVARSGGRANYLLPLLARGYHSLHYVYGGSTTVAGSTSRTLRLRVV